MTETVTGHFIMRILSAASLLTLLAPSALADPPHKIQFSGFEWTVKESVSMGPGPNAWNPKNVWVDAKGQLHLKISQRGGKWECAEVASTQHFGFGNYEFQISGPIDKFDPQIVLGLFNYPTREIGGDGTNEIDIEFARWGNAKWPNGNFTVWPPVESEKNGSDTFNFTLNQDETTHRFTWSSESVVFESRTDSGDARSQIIHSWKYEPEEFLRRVGQHPEPVLMNLWLFRGKPPMDSKEVEIVVKKFRFTAEKAVASCE